MRTAGRSATTLRLDAALFIMALAVRLAASGAAGTLQEHPDIYYIHLEEGIIPNFGAHHPSAHGLGNVYANALLFILGGLHESVYAVLLCVIGALIPLLMIRLARRLLPEATERTIGITGWLAVFFPPLVLVSATWWHTLFPVLFALLHLFTALDETARPGRWWLKNTVSGALLLLTRPDYILPGTILILLRNIAWRRRLAAILLPVALVMLHNRFASGSGQPWVGDVWQNLYTNNSSLARHAYIGFGPELWSPELALEEELRRGEKLPGVEGKNSERLRFFHFVRHKPDLYFEGLVMKAARLFDVHRDGALLQGPIENSAYSLPLLAVLCLAAIGFGALLSKTDGRSAAWRFLAVFAGYALPMIVIQLADRTRVPIQALWLVLAAYACESFRRPSQITRT